MVKEQFSEKYLGYAGAISGIIYGQHFHIHKMKDPNYTMVLMTTYVALERSDNKIKYHVNGKTVWFKYPCIFLNYSINQHATENHINRQQSPNSIEKT